ncbi:MAG: hypothetical protein CL760_12090 [Chloroflexi bacterium]|nr:hypothetical protein [Chloroflexota bacterium]
MKKKLIYLLLLDACLFIYFTYLNVNCGYDCKVWGTKIPVIMAYILSLTTGLVLIFILILNYFITKKKKC